MKGMMLLVALPLLVLCQIYDRKSLINSQTVKDSIGNIIKKDAAFKETSSHSHYIVHLSLSFPIESLEDHLSSRSGSLNVHHRYRKVLHGLTVSGIELEHIMSHPGVLRVVRDSVKYSTVLAWGLDRINQKDLPLDNDTTTAYHGEGIDVYVLDSGLDTTHIEFATNRFGRKVISYDTIQDINGVTSMLSSINNDGNGHGTHVAGTIGGNTVGVSPGANIFAIKILSDSGSGSTSLIIGALEWVAQQYEALGKMPSIVSMSLGGDCESSDCEIDSLVLAVEALIAMGIKVSVAAGNDGANACFGSPNAAPSAIVSGASSVSDQVAEWSNFGQCVDIFAPGVDILSALTSSLDTSKSLLYALLSGTSMACPHTTGVLAQLMQKSPTASNEDLRRTLTCDGSQSRLSLNSLDRLSRNILLQTPTIDEPTAVSSTCNLGTNCPNECSSRGVCDLIPISNNGTYYVCHCDNGYEGSNCSINSTNNACSGGAVQLEMGDNGLGKGWSYARFAILDASGLVVASATDSLSLRQTYTNRSYCIAPGTYTFQVTRGKFPAGVVWGMCGNIGGGPYLGMIAVTLEGQCNFYCTDTIVELVLRSASNSSWKGAYFGLYSEASGTQLYGGSMLTTDIETIAVCLVQGTYILLFEQFGDNPKDVSIDICGLRVSSNDIIRVTIASAVCTVVRVNSPAIGSGTTDDTTAGDDTTTDDIASTDDSVFYYNDGGSTFLPTVGV